MVDRIARRAIGPDESVRANRGWWDRAADWYQATHGEFLRDVGFIWCPEALDEAEAALLGPIAGRRILEVGCGAAQCSRWLLAQAGPPTAGGSRHGTEPRPVSVPGHPRSRSDGSGRPELVVGLDLSYGQLAHAIAINRRTGIHPALVQADAQRLPLADETFDIACSAYGAIPFVADSARVMREVARVLRPGGRWVFAVPHPIRWCFPDDPGEAGLVARHSYWDRRPYVEEDDQGNPTYAEHHRTIGDRIREITAAGLTLIDLVEPEWPDGHDRAWDAWSPLRGRILPGTAIFVCVKPT